MASAEQQLQDLIAGVRREAEAEGYARAWREIMDAANKALGIRTTAVVDLLKQQRRDAPPAPNAGRIAEEIGRGRRRRGRNGELVMGVLEMMGSSMSATEIQRALASEGIAYSSVRNALSQLVIAGKVVEFPGGYFEAKKQMAPSEPEEAI
jgi:hypothetical protein